MENIYSSKRKKLALHSEIHPDVIVPQLVTPSAQAKYRLMRHCLLPGLGITFNSFPNLLEKIRHVGWDCLVIFSDRHIYPGLIAEFYSHMVFNRDENGLLISISTCIQGIDYIIDEQLLINALYLRESMLDLPRINEYVYPMGTSVSDCMFFKQNLAAVTDQIVPAQIFDFPVPVGLEYLTAQSQFLGKIIRQNFMPVRVDRNLFPFDLEMIKCILNECMPYNLPFFLLTSFEHCFHNNCLGISLLLTHVFKHLGIDIINHPSQVVHNSNIVSHLNLPPRPLFVFKESDHDSIESHLNMICQMDTLSNMNQLMLHNQSNMMVQIEDLQQVIHHMQDMMHILMENQKLPMPPHHFSASTSSAKVEPMDQSPPDALLPILGLHFSPIPLGDF